MPYISKLIFACYNLKKRFEFNIPGVTEEKVSFIFQ